MSRFSGPDIPPALIDVIARQCAEPVPEACTAITAAIRESYGAALRGVLLYGSCSRDEAMEDGIVDIYAIVDDYKSVYEKRYLAYLNAWLAPNVFYREISGKHGLIRIKLALISLADFTGGIMNWFHSYLWGRFAQPARILYARDETVRRAIHRLMAQAVLTLLKTSIPTLQEESGNAETIWTRALSLSYSAEYRPEPGAKAGQLVRSDLTGYAGLLDAALPMLDTILRRQSEDNYLRLSDHRTMKAALCRWRLRRRQGRVLSVLRLMKATLTFQNGVDYAAWKINRHTGVTIEVTPELRRHPLLFGWRVFRQLIKRGVIH